MAEKAKKPKDLDPKAKGKQVQGGRKFTSKRQRALVNRVLDKVETRIEDNG
jgi:hypothetical protein